MRIFFYYLLTILLLNDCKSVERVKMPEPHDFTAYIENAENYLIENFDSAKPEKDLKFRESISNLRSCNEYSKTCFRELDLIAKDLFDAKQEISELNEENKKLFEYKLYLIYTWIFIFCIVIFFLFKDFILTLVRTKLGL